MPLALGSTRNSVSPSRSPAAPAVRAATISRSAVWPSTTKALSPFSLNPLPERTACILVCSGRCLAPSSIASAASSEPSAYLRQVLGFLRGAAAARQRGRRQHGGRKKRRRHQGAADFLHHHAGLDAAEPAAAEILRHQQAGKSHLGERLPQVAGKPGRVLGVAQLPQMRHRRLVADEAARAVAQHRLFFVEDECHWVIPVQSCSRRSILRSSFRDAS